MEKAIGKEATSTTRKRGVGGGNGVAAVGRQYKGIRMRKWGKWVAEIRMPNKRSRIWLGSYATPVAAARAYDTAVFYLRGPSARLNFPECVSADSLIPPPADVSAASIRRRAAEVGARVDALETTALNHRGDARREEEVKSFLERVDLNKLPDPEDASDTDWEEE